MRNDRNFYYYNYSYSQIEQRIERVEDRAMRADTSEAITADMYDIQEMQAALQMIEEHGAQIFDEEAA